MDAEQELQKCEEKLEELIVERIKDTENYDFHGDWFGVVSSLASDDTIYNLAQKFDSSSLLLKYEQLYKSEHFYRYGTFYGYDMPETLCEMNVIIAYSLLLEYLETNTKRLFEKEVGENETKETK